MKILFLRKLLEVIVYMVVTSHLPPLPARSVPVLFWQAGTHLTYVGLCALRPEEFASTRAEMSRGGPRKRAGAERTVGAAAGAAGCPLEVCVHSRLMPAVLLQALSPTSGFQGTLRALFTCTLLLLFII